MAERNLDELAKKYGATVSVEDIAAKYGGTISEAAPATPQSQPTPAGPKPRESGAEKQFRQLMMGASPVELQDRIIGVGQKIGKGGLGALQWFQHLTGNKVTPTPVWLEPKNVEQDLGQKVTEFAATSLPAIATAGASLPVAATGAAITGGLQSESPGGAILGGAIPVVGKGASAFWNSIPSKQAAGAKFQKVMSKARDVPINTTEAEKIAQRAQELRGRGSTFPKVMNDFAKNRRAATGDFMTQPVTEPMTYEVGRDFASASSALSSREATALNRPMHNQVTQFAKALKDANREAAQKVGMGDLYDEAMKEYARASSLEEKTAFVQKWAVRAGLAALGVRGAQEAWNLFYSE